MGEVKPTPNPYFLDGTIEWMMVMITEMGVLEKEMVV